MLDILWGMRLSEIQQKQILIVIECMIKKGRLKNAFYYSIIHQEMLVMDRIIIIIGRVCRSFGCQFRGAFVGRRFSIEQLFWTCGKNYVVGLEGMVIQRFVYIIFVQILKMKQMQQLYNSFV
eukprot:TRINITY_DN104103_c0_g1_i3.p6 TRINITY_DN104103_c0_g1~~TRINITY_DN104103_c0_g1_i3.p6  ORF type:complete len:122 (+),score=7.03 TRINITY_DN104103_c0_g1_i3:461-826(+)